MAITVKHKFVSAIPDGTDATIVRPSNWNDDHDLTGTIPVANGGTGASTAANGLNNLLPSQTGNNGKVLATDGTNATWTTNGSGDVVGPASSTNNAIARFDSTTGKLIKNSGVTVDNNNNINANALDDAYTKTAASGTLITLTVASPRRYTITGSGGQVIKLPDATTLTNGTVFQFDNNQSSGAITVNNNSNTLVVSVPSGGFVLVNLLSNAIAAGSWDRHDQAPSNVSWSTNTFDYAGSITSATWNGNTVAVNRGGTGVTTSTGSGSNVLNTSPTLTTPAITGGTIDNAVIGGTTPAAGKFTTLESTGTGSFGTTSAQYIQAVGNATEPQILAVGSGTNIPLVLQPKGTGALQAQATTSSTVGGNARGANAVDWQMSRSSAGQVASGANSVVIGGRRNTASGQDNFVGSGYQNNASGGLQATIAGGANNTNSANNAGFIGSGSANTVSGDFSSVVGGYSNTTAGTYNFIGGGYSNAGTASAAVTTQSGTMNGTTAVTLSGSNASIKVGQLVTGTSITYFPGTYVAAISGTALTLSQAASGSSTSTLSFYTPHGVVVGGGNNQATGSYSFIGGGGDAGTAANRNVASGDWSFVGGGINNRATGVGALVVGGGTDGIIAGNLASGILSTVVGGRSNTASANYSFVHGAVSNTASGSSSSVFGGAYATTRGIVGNSVTAASETPLGTFVAGNSQAALLVLGVETTNATATVLRSNTSAAGTTNQVILPNNSAYFFTGEVVSGVTGGGNTKGWTIEGVIKRGANAASTALVGSPTVTSTYADAGASTWALAVTADTTNGGIRVTFTGQASTTIRTVCQIRTTEMTY